MSHRQWTRHHQLYTFHAVFMVFYLFHLKKQKQFWRNKYVVLYFIILLVIHFYLKVFQHFGQRQKSVQKSACWCRDNIKDTRYVQYTGFDRYIFYTSIIVVWDTNSTGVRIFAIFVCDFQTFLLVVARLTAEWIKQNKNFRNHYF